MTLNCRDDIFDRLMRLPVLNIFEQVYKKHKEILLYLFFGVLTFLISIGTYAAFSKLLGMDALIANVFSWIFSVSFAYVTNRHWVFETRAVGTTSILKEFGKFLSGRLATLAVEELILLVFITWLRFDSMAVKLAAQVVVIVLNYVISKLWVFTKQ